MFPGLKSHINAKIEIFYRIFALVKWIYDEKRFYQVNNRNIGAFICNNRTSAESSGSDA